MHQREIRLALLRNGHLPIPVQGKRPLLQNWQNLDPDEEMIARWGDQGDNTGVLCRRTAALDIDFDDAAAVQIVLAVVRDRIRGLILERTGRAPKCAVPMYVPEPFKKVIRKFTAPDGRVHKIEFLCDGQQFVVAGTHPDTGSPYTWRDRDLMRTSLMELPVVRESDIEGLLQRCAEELKVKLGWIDISNVAPDSSGADPNNIVQFTPIAERAEKMQYGGEFPINDTLLVYSGDQLRDGRSCKQVIQDCLSRAQKAYEEIPGDPQERPIWDWVQMRHQIEAMVYGYIAKYHGEQPRIVEALPSSLLKKWRAIESAGGTPHFQKRRFWGVEDKGPDDPIPDVEAIPTIEPPKPSAPFVLRPRGIIDPAAIPPRRWLGGGQFYQRRTVSTTIAPGDTGKTTLGMLEGVSMQTGRCLLGDFPDEKLRIWIHNGEDSRDELDRKLAAVCLYNDIPLSDVADIFLTTASDIPLRVASGYSEIVPDKPLIKCIHEQIGDNKIDVAMFDPLITLHGVPESDNGKMDQVIRIFAAIADAQNCSVSLAQHVRKGPAGEDYDYRVEDARGASAVRDAVRAARVLNRMSEKQAIEVGIPPHDRAAYIRIDRAKGNYSRIGGETRWLTFDNVDLPQGDSVGVLKLWLMPGAEGATEIGEKADVVFLGILRRFNAEGRRASDRRGMNFAPKLFAREREAKEAKVGVAALEKAMRRLLAEFRIKMVDDGSGGRVVHELQVVE